MQSQRESVVNRYVNLQAFIIHIYPIGEMHYGVKLLSETRGLLSAIAYGARTQTGKLHGKLEQFALGRYELYASGEQKMWKVNDCEIYNYYSFLRSDLIRYCYASLWYELIFRTFRGEDHTKILFGQLSQAMDGLRTSTTQQVKVHNICFIWNYIALLGLQPYFSLQLQYCHPSLCELSTQPRDGWIRIDRDMIYLLNLCQRKKEDAFLAKNISISCVQRTWQFLRAVLFYLSGGSLNTLHATHKILT